MRRRISKPEAVAIARRVCEGRELPWTGPIRMYRKFWNQYQVWTSADRRGGNVIITVDRRTGEVLGCSVTPR